VLAIANMTEIAPVLDRRSIPELAVPKLLLDVPMGATIRGRIEMHPLQRGNRSIDRAFTGTWDLRQCFLGSTAKSGSSGRRQRPS
jgi:hypothetical protein